MKIHIKSAGCSSKESNQWRNVDKRWQSLAINRVHFTFALIAGRLAVLIDERRFPAFTIVRHRMLCLHGKTFSRWVSSLKHERGATKRHALWET